MGKIPEQIWQYLLPPHLLPKPTPRGISVVIYIMSDQPTPTVTSADVDRIVRRDFPAEQVADVLEMLDEFGKEEWHRETHRVRLAALKLAAGRIERLRTEVEGAKCDYRDVLAAAEYPGYFRRVPGPGKLPAAEVQRIIDADWKQYQEWFRR